MNQVVDSKDGKQLEAAVFKGGKADKSDSRDNQDKRDQFNRRVNLDFVKVRMPDVLPNKRLDMNEINSKSRGCRCLEKSADFGANRHVDAPKEDHNGDTEGKR